MMSSMSAVVVVPLLVVAVAVDLGLSKGLELSLLTFLKVFYS
jgi:hypothetical protein